MNPKTGDFCKLYKNSGTHTVPVFAEWSEIDGVEVPDLTRSKVPLNVRGLTATPSLSGKIGELSATFNYVPGFNDTNYAELLEEFFTSSEVAEWFIADGDAATSGTQGLLFPAYVSGIPYHQASGAPVSHDVTLSYGFMKNGTEVLNPVWNTIS